MVDLSEMVKKETKRIKTENGSVPAFLTIDVDVEITMGSDKGVLLVTAKHGTSRTKLGKTSIEYVADPAWKGALVVGEH